MYLYFLFSLALSDWSLDWNYCWLTYKIRTQTPILTTITLRIKKKLAPL
jgi:hypothetical protein